ALKDQLAYTKVVFGDQPDGTPNLVSFSKDVCGSVSFTSMLSATGLTTAADYKVLYDDYNQMVQALQPMADDIASQVIAGKDHFTVDMTFLNKVVDTYDAQIQGYLDSRI